MNRARTEWTGILIAKVLVLVLITVTPRALLAPGPIYDRAVESKRPKSPKHIVRVDPIRIADLEMQGQEPPLPGRDLLEEAFNGRLVQALPVATLPREAFTPLTSPSYLRPTPAAHPRNHLDPPL